MFKMLLTHRAPESVLAPYRDRFDFAMPQAGRQSFSREEAIAAIPDCDAMFSMGAFPIQRDIIEPAKRMRAAGTFGVGYDHIDLAACTEHGVFICNTPKMVCESTAEFSAALLLSLVKGIPRFDASLRKTMKSGADLFLDRDILLYGKRVGIIGFGRIGQAVARKLSGFGVELCYSDPMRLSPEHETGLNVRFLPFEELLQSADVVSCHMLYNESTHHIMDAAAFAKMKPQAYFVNTSRGKTVDEAALIAALESGRLRGAALDVYEYEPEVSEAFREMDNVVITPHVASSVLEAKTNMVAEAFDGVLDILEGKRPHNIVNTDLLKKIILN
jgi:lactate dehydrogenase-like 2-hydroxyacid dehydrogenase